MASSINADNGVSSGSAGLKSSADSSGVLQLQTNGTTAVTVDTSQNVGVGVVPSAWSLGKIAQIGTTTALWNDGSNNTYLSTNAYYNSGFKYLTSGLATSYVQSTTFGTHTWSVAPTGTAGNPVTLTTAMTLDANGNLGLGVTPSAWNSAAKALQYSTSGSLWAVGGQSRIGNNHYYDATGTFRYLLSGAIASDFSQTSGGFSWSIAPSGTAGNAVTFTTSMVLDSSGRLGVGTTTPVGKLTVVGGNSNNLIVDNDGSQYTQLLLARNGTANTGGDLLIDGTNATMSLRMLAVGALRFCTSTSIGDGTERARITSDGSFLVGTTSVINSCKVSIVANNSLGLKGSSATGSGDISFNRADNGAQAWRIASDGTNWYLADADFSNFAYVAQNFTAWSFGSDRRIKTDIEDIGYGLNAVMAMKPRQYKMLVSGMPSIGFVAQELQTVIPEAVQGEEIEYLDTDTPQQKAAKTMGVSKETLIPVLVKAIQEQQALITQLQADVAALKGA